MFPQAIMESLAAGSFLYVALVDIICEEFNQPASWRKRFELRYQHDMEDSSFLIARRPRDRYSLFLSLLLGIVLIIAVLFWNELL